MQLEINKVKYPCRPHWSEYKFVGNTQGRTVRKIFLSSFNIPDIKDISGKDYRRIALEIDSNNGVFAGNSTVPGMYVSSQTSMTGTNQRQFILAKNADNKWVVQGNPYIDYCTNSLTFTIKIRVWEVVKNAFFSPPNSPAYDWSVDLAIS